GAEVSWLVCNPETCIPGKATLERTFEAGKATDDARAIAATRELLPREAPWKASLRAGEGQLELAVNEPALAQARIVSAYFFPGDNEVIDHAAKQVLVQNADGLALRFPPHEYAEGTPDELEGVLVLEEDLGGSK